MIITKGVFQEKKKKKHKAGMLQRLPGHAGLIKTGYCLLEKHRGFKHCKVVEEMNRMKTNEAEDENGTRAGS